MAPHDVIGYNFKLSIGFQVGQLVGPQETYRNALPWPN